MHNKLITQLEKREKEHYWHQAKHEIIKSTINNFFSLQTTAPKRKLLDIGCGSGVNLSKFDHIFSCSGIEPNPLLAQQARENCKAIIYQQSMPANIPALKNEFDIILLLDALEHINNDVGTLKSITPLLKKGGIIIINVPALPALWSTHDEVAHHKRRYTKKSLQLAIHQAGLNISLIRYWNSLALPLVYFKRRIVHRSSKINDYKLSTPLPILNSILKKILIAEYIITKPLLLPFGLSLLTVVHKQNKKKNL